MSDVPRRHERYPGHYDSDDKGCRGAIIAAIIITPLAILSLILSLHALIGR